MRESLDQKVALALTSNSHLTISMKQSSRTADGSFMGKFASLPTTSHCPPNWTNAIDVNLHTSTGHSHIHPHQQARKRRRGEIANPANTLDGLVAKRADDIGASESLIKRYLTENEAIESPSDDQELKRIETDPDVSTRTCSICGYQGKWVSEMIRHKRVHTNERPFKCKYCSRTSKWKADLIRHVAKTHGIRVVSKYSRSKTFDASTTALHELKDNKPEALQTQSKPLPYTINVDPLPPPAINSSPSNKQTTSYLLSSEREHQHDNINKLERAPIAYRCVLCLFEQESLLVLMSHLRNVHNAAFYECRNCACSFMDAMNATEHFDNSSTCSSNALYANIAPIYATQNEHSAFSVCGASKGSSAEELLRGLFNSSSSCANSFLPLIQTLNQSQSFGISTTNCDSNRSLLNVLSTYANLESGACDKCPYKGDNDAFLTHKKGHDIPKGLLNYKCVFCDWFAKRKNSIEEHMRVHTSNPQLYMPQVEKNLITPVTIAKYATDSNAAAAVISSDEHLFGNNSFTNTSRISASAATPEQLSHIPYQGVFGLNALLALKQQSSDVTSMLSLTNLAALSGAIGSRIALSQCNNYSTISNEQLIRSTAPSLADAENVSVEQLNLNASNVTSDEKSFALADNNLTEATFNMPTTVERFRTPSPTDSSTSSCSAVSTIKSAADQLLRLNSFASCETASALTDDLCKSDMVHETTAKMLSDYQQCSKQNNERKMMTDEDDEIVDVENVDERA